MGGGGGGGGGGMMVVEKKKRVSLGPEARSQFEPFQHVDVILKALSDALPLYLAFTSYFY